MLTCHGVGVESVVDDVDELVESAEADVGDAVSVEVGVLAVELVEEVVGVTLDVPDEDALEVEVFVAGDAVVVEEVESVAVGVVEVSACPACPVAPLSADGTGV